MPRTPLALLLLAAAACAPAQSEAVRHHTEDGYHLFARGSYADARDCFDAALKLKPGDPDLLYNLARCHERTGQAEKAEALYKECLSANPDHAEARHAWLLLMLQGGREEEGKQMVVGWMKSRPDKGSPYVEDAYLYARDGDLDRARRRYQQALNLDPRNHRAMTGLAGIYEKLGRPDRALRLYESALEVKPDQPEVEARVKELRGKGVSGPKPD
jgi:Tfp pilus assembly protein PilF